MLLKGKTAIVTGGSRGIGKAIVEKFVENGCNVAFTYIHNDEQAKLLEDTYKNASVKVKSYKSNAGLYSECELLVQQVTEDFGNVDVLVNNAGITRDNLLLRMTEEQWNEVIEANLKSVFNLTKHLSKSMLRNKSGSIINLTSIVGEKGQAGQANYAASKAGIIGFTKSIADEFGSRNIRCNAIAPGFIETDMTGVLSDSLKNSILDKIPMKRMGRANEVADAALFLASDMSTYISGQVLSVCGGMNR
ncbi:MAG: 3-oxoacyl-[acyl-carrier-protein] reductase [Chitinophagales bacterium]|jgi:3-oxoacyl-[acyl-carrier protein] reductase|nr:3-oxoacyl-[acyl-carrier-protein] reductase [Chitinophagales bacterium]